MLSVCPCYNHRCYLFLLQTHKLFLSDILHLSTHIWPPPDKLPFLSTIPCSPLKDWKRLHTLKRYSTASNSWLLFPPVNVPHKVCSRQQVSRQWPNKPVTRSLATDVKLCPLCWYAKTTLTSEPSAAQNSGSAPAGPVASANSGNFTGMMKWSTHSNPLFRLHWIKICR